MNSLTLSPALRKTALPGFGSVKNQHGYYVGSPRHETLQDKLNAALGADHQASLLGHVNFDGLNVDDVRTLVPGAHHANDSGRNHRMAAMAEVSAAALRKAEAPLSLLGDTVKTQVIPAVAALTKTLAEIKAKAPVLSNSQLARDAYIKPLNTQIGDLRKVVGDLPKDYRLLRAQTPSTREVWAISPETRLQEILTPGHALTDLLGYQPDALRIDADAMRRLVAVVDKSTRRIDLVSERATNRLTAIEALQPKLAEAPAVARNAASQLHQIAKSLRTLTQGEVQRAFTNPRYAEQRQALTRTLKAQLIGFHDTINRFPVAYGLVQRP